MRIASNTVTDTILNQLQQGSVNQSNLQTQISTGLRISQPSDDPAAYGRVLNYQTSQREVAQYAKNASTALAVSQASYAGLQSLNSVSDRAGELAVLGASTLGATSMQSYAVEVNQLIEQAVQLGNTQYNNNYLYAGTAVDTPPFDATRDADGQITAVAYVGNTSQASIPLAAGSSVAPGAAGATNTGIGDFITRLIALRDALNSGDTSAVNATQAGLTDSGNLIISAVAETGGIQTRIEAAQSDLQSRATTLDTLISNEDSTDITTAVVKLSQAQTAYQAALASASKIMNTSLLDYIQ
jgi:flagellar hook-associated protein 3 FlgL